MWDQEKVHLGAFEDLLRRHAVRPSALSPLWYATGYSIGYLSAFLGKESAMALTESIETVIGAHYNE